jgi:hypothetical protein
MDPKSLVECKRHLDWNKWKDAIEADIDLLYKREVFFTILQGILPTPLCIFLVGYK